MLKFDQQIANRLYSFLTELFLIVVVLILHRLSIVHESGEHYFQRKHFFKNRRDGRRCRHYEATMG